MIHEHEKIKKKKEKTRHMVCNEKRQPTREQLPIIPTQIVP